MNPVETLAVQSQNERVSFKGLDDTTFRRELRQMIRERLELAEDASPVAVVDGLLQEIVKTKRYDLLVTAARVGIREVAANLVRHDAVRRDDERRRGGAESGKWDNAAQAVRDQPDLFMARVRAEGGWKFLADCNRSDLEFAADRKLRQAAGLTDSAERLRKLARKLSKGQVVRDLERPVVEGIFDA